MAQQDKSHGALTAEQVADSIRDDAWRATTLRLDDALGRQWQAGGPERFARDGSRGGDATRGASSRR